MRARSPELSGKAMGGDSTRRPPPLSSTNSPSGFIFCRGRCPGSAAGRSPAPAFPPAPAEHTDLPAGTGTLLRARNRRGVGPGRRQVQGGTFSPVCLLYAPLSGGGGSRTAGSGVAAGTAPAGAVGAAALRPRLSRLNPPVPPPQRLLLPPRSGGGPGRAHGCRRRSAGRGRRAPRRRGAAAPGKAVPRPDLPAPPRPRNRENRPGRGEGRRRPNGPGPKNGSPRSGEARARNVPARGTATPAPCSPPGLGAKTSNAGRNALKEKLVK